MRSKTEWVIGQNRDGKNTPEKLGLAPEQGKGIEYEFDLLMELNQQHQGIITKDRTGKFQDETINKPGEAFGVALYDWLSIGNAVVPPASPPVTPQQSVITQKGAIPASTVSPSQSTTPQPTPTQAPVSDPKQAELKTTGTTLVKEIGEILNTVSRSGQPYFTNEEKAEAHQLVVEVTVDEKGIKALQDFKACLSGVLQERQPDHTRKAA
jgi:hypothetical protein